MLIAQDKANWFLVNYKAAITHTVGKRPQNLEEWVAGRDVLYNNTDLSDDMPVEPKLIQALKSSVFGRFVFLKRYKPHCAFMHLETQQFYGVLSLTDPLEQMIPEYTLVQTAVMPIGDEIICDGLIAHLNVGISRNIAKELRNGYWQARKDGSLITSMTTS